MFELFNPFLYENVTWLAIWCETKNKAFEIKRFNICHVWTLENYDLDNSKTPRKRKEYLFQVLKYT